MHLIELDFGLLRNSYFIAICMQHSLPHEKWAEYGWTQKNWWHGIQDISNLLLDLAIQSVFNNSIKYMDILAIKGAFRKNAHKGYGCAP